MNIKSVAIIGAGPSGLTSLYELLHTSNEGESTVGGDLPSNPQFTKITVFELNSDVGGVWNSSLNETDSPIPPQDLLKTQTYNDPYQLKPTKDIPSFGDKFETMTSSLKGYSQCSHSAIYRNLYTNIPKQLMRFSYSKNYEETSENFEPFVSHSQVKNFLIDFATDEDLLKYIRFNTEVESATYDEESKKWTIISRQSKEKENKDIWKSEQYDGVIVANGRLNIPYFPLIPGLPNYILNFPNIVKHAKAFRRAEDYKDKTVLIVGGSVSSVDIIQYLFPIAGQIYVSRRSGKAIYEWMDTAITSKGIATKPQISKFNEDGSVEFIDGTTIDPPDSIILATGYHYHYPFLKKGIAELSSSIIFPSNAPRVQNLYFHTFYMENPSLAFVGIPYVSTPWYGFETAAAAISGVWSGASELPSISEQRLWEANRLKDTSDTSRFQAYPSDITRDQFIDPLIQLAPKGRTNPLDIHTGTAELLLDSLKSSEELFFKLKEGRIQLAID